MIRLHKTFLLLACSIAAGFGGCSGGYVLTVPDQVAPAGGDATVVIRLQHHEFAGYYPAVKGACIGYRAGDGPQRGAFTDKDGYAGAHVPAPALPGRYHVVVHHIDKNGVESRQMAPLYAWEPARPIVAVDMDCLPKGGHGRVASQASLAAIAQNSNIIYMTRQGVAAHGRLHGELKSAGFPDGPILPWQHQNWRVEQDGKMPRVIVESRLVSQLASMRKSFPNLAVGICNDSVAAESFARAGMKVVIIGQEKVDIAKVPAVSRARTWAEVDISRE